MSGVTPFLLASADVAAQDLSMFHPASPQAGSISHLTLLVFTVTGFIFVVVEGILFYSIFRFRRRTSDSKAEPPQVYGSKPIEIAWTAAPALVVFVFVLVTARTLWEVNKPPPQEPPTEHRDNDDALFVTVIGHQWWWEYRYAGYNGDPLDFTTANELHVPAGHPVYLKLKSADVCHSFWVPRLAGKTDLIPGHDNNMWFIGDKPDLYLGQCAEYCGTQHANMLLRVVVESPEEFKVWLDNEKEKAVGSGSKNPSKGEVVFTSQSCAQCHQIRGTTAHGTAAPDLTHLRNRTTLASGMIPVDPAQPRWNRTDLESWINDPQKMKPGCLMPGFRDLSEEERKNLIDYLMSLH